MSITHAGENRFVGSCFCMPFQRGVFSDEAGECLAELGHIGLGDGMNRDLSNWIGLFNGRHFQLVAFVTEGVVGVSVAQFNDGTDVAAVQFSDAVLFLAGQNLQGTNADFAIALGIPNAAVGFQNAAVDANVAHTAVWIFACLKYKGSQWRTIIYFVSDAFTSGVGGGESPGFVGGREEANQRVH